MINNNLPKSKNADVVAPFNTDPKLISYIKVIEENSYLDNYSHNCFVIFISKRGKLTLSYYDNFALINYDLDNYEIIIKKYIKCDYSGIYYYYDKKSNNDILLISNIKNRSIEIYNVEELIYMHKITLFNEKNNIIKYILFLNYRNNEILIIGNGYFSCLNNDKTEVYKINGKCECTFKNSFSGVISYFDVYSDDKESKYYFIGYNKENILLFDYDNRSIVNEYYDKMHKNYYYGCAVNISQICIQTYKDKKKSFLIAGYDNGKLNVWNFSTSDLTCKIYLKGKINTICLWNLNFCFIGLDNSNILLFDITNERKIKTFKIHNNGVSSIKKINHPQYGNCIISRGFKKDKIILWFNRNN